ncbi:glycosyltransferase family 2 protein [Photobacterium phosphoreum]|uniref:glycosyltransferase family 2 protein n=1 Tax=Photobacterium phosphoreum TaxID=659 RepID=UPI0039AF913D
MIFAVVILYNPDLSDLKKSLNILKKQVDFIVIGNNSNYPIEVNYLSDVKIFNFMDNLGIAKAQSLCMKWAFDNDAEYIIQMDQDSIPHSDLVQKLLLCSAVLQEKGLNIGIVGSVDYDKDDKDHFIKKKSFKSIGCCNVLFTDYIISSGSLISKNVYETIGGMDDDLFIDLVDFEYCWRSSSKGFVNVKCYEANIAHKVGQGILKKGFLKLYTPNPIRQYYQYRNFILLLKRNYVPLKWKIIELIKCISNIFLSPLFLGEYKLRINYIFKGIRDGIIGIK